MKTSERQGKKKHDNIKSEVGKIKKQRRQKFQSSAKRGNPGLKKKVWNKCFSNVTLPLHSSRCNLMTAITLFIYY